MGAVFENPTMEDLCDLMCGKEEECEEMTGELKEKVFDKYSCVELGNMFGDDWPDRVDTLQDDEAKEIIEAYETLKQMKDFLLLRKS